jgi:hypothetical protein
MAYFQVSMDWRCLACRGEGTRWFAHEADSIYVPGSSALNIDYGNQLEMAEVDHSLTGCNGRLEQEGGTCRKVTRQDLQDPLWLEVVGK